jgi:hypothetical protein
MNRARIAHAILLGSACWLASAQAGTASAPAPAATATILDLQPGAQTQSVEVADGGATPARITLLNLNPRINAWYLLSIERAGAEPRRYHLENADPARQSVHLDERGELLLSGIGAELHCALGGAQSPNLLDRARASALPYAPLCGERLYLRNKVAGTYTDLERVTNFLRDHVWGGEQIISFAKNRIYDDAFVEPAIAADDKDGSRTRAPPDAPPDATLPGAKADIRIVPTHLGIDAGTRGGLLPGRWYAVPDASGIYVSATQPLTAYQSGVAGVDTVEAGALDYLVAFDLSHFDLGFELGTDHPRVGWSPRILDTMRDVSRAGPDGIADSAPLARNGMINPVLAARTAAAFTGGFKREHGAFRYGDLATRNAGSHYGFIQQGTLFSKLQPGLATLYVLDDGSVGMKTWSAEDNSLLPRIRHARQNGVALVEYDAASGRSTAGKRVTQWGPGNWSGSKEEKLRTLRAGACLMDSAGRHYLIYGYFSTATPAAMAQVFQAYGCRYAMHLDMNALEHTYLAIYTRTAQGLKVQHLVAGMEAVDNKGGTRVSGDGFRPRFLAFPDDRDFFYLTRREPAR